MARKVTRTRVESRTILLVDDNEEYRNATRIVLEAEGHQVFLAADGAEAIDQVDRNSPDLVLLDFFMPRMNGDEVVQILRRRDPHLQIILQTGYSGENPPLEMLRDLDIQGYFDKSEGIEKLLLWTEVGLKAAQTQRKLAQNHHEKVEQLGHLVIGVSHHMNTPLGNAIMLASHLGDLLETLMETQEGQGLTKSGLNDFLTRAGETRTSLERNLGTCRNLVNRFKQTSVNGDVPTVPVSVPRLAADSLFLARQGRPGQSARLEIDCPEGWEFPVKKEFLGLVFQELMGNSLDFAGVPGRELEIRIQVAPGDHSLTLVYDDNGQGIQERHLPSLFTPFFTTALGPRHAGLGLYTVHVLVTVHLGGTITAHRSPGGTLGFTVTLPVD